VSRLVQPRGRFREVARRKLADAQAQEALTRITTRAVQFRPFVWEGVDLESLRERASRIRGEAVRNLPRYLDEFQAAVEARGGHVHRCASAEEAQAAVVRICHDAGATLAAKSKSMVSEELDLNHALEAAGIRAVETDLGEYIMQLAGEPPTHIIGPAIEKSAAQVAALLGAVDGQPLDADPEGLLAVARRQLREIFLTADVGITGANFGVAETGSICLVTNEGNGRLVTSLPRVHVALLGMERLVPTLADLATMLRVLPRSGTGQQLTTYTTLITGPRREGESDGPEELHVIVVDNGRSKLRGTRYEEMLKCIRCGACLNVCPVYGKTGGHAYGPVYSGPMGAVLAPLLVGIERAPTLPHASSLCGACTAVCPVEIPLHELLLELRRDLVERRVASWRERLAFALWSLAWSSPAGFRLSMHAARLLQPLARLTRPGRAWTAGHNLPRLR
jgi:L-lactate dehydrogenase complex protein LldF